jgi:protein Mpv17
MAGRFPSRAFARGFSAGGGVRRRLGGGGGGAGPRRDVSRADAASNRAISSGASNGGKSGASSSSSSSLNGLLQRYAAMNEAHPTTTRVGTGVVILCVGDVAAQRIQHEGSRDRDSKPFAIDARRLAAFASFGAIYTSWFQMHWFRALQRWFPRRSVMALSTATKRPSLIRADVLAPLLINQFVAVPTLYYPFYFAWTGFVRGFTAEESIALARERFTPRLLCQNWAFWLPAQFAQFAVVPPGYHILYVSGMGLGAFYTLVPIRPRSRGERRSLRTFAGVSLRPHLAFNPRFRRLSTPPDAFQLHPDIRLYGTTLSVEHDTLAEHAHVRGRAGRGGRGED